MCILCDQGKPQKHSRSQLGRRDFLKASTLAAAGASGMGLFLFVAQALGIGLRGWTADWLNALFGELEARQVGIGAGGALVLIALLSLLSTEGAAKSGKLGKLVGCEIEGMFIARTGYTGEEGFEIMVP